VREVTYCHCEQCRRQSGHFVAATACDDDQLSISGAGNLSWYAASDGQTRFLPDLRIAPVLEGE
jgi:hypothetical protein